MLRCMCNNRGVSGSRILGWFGEAERRGHTKRRWNFDVGEFAKYEPPGARGESGVLVKTGGEVKRGGDPHRELSSNGKGKTIVAPRNEGSGSSQKKKGG